VIIGWDFLEVTLENFYRTPLIHLSHHLFEQRHLPPRWFRDIIATLNILAITDEGMVSCHYVSAEDK
jgi:hypothetical protein